MVGRIDHQGCVLTPLDEGSAVAAIKKLLGNGVEAIAVCLINAYVNGEHERRIGELIAARAPALPVCLSSEILPEIKEYERTSTAVVNAYILPVVSQYLTALSASLERLGVTAPLLVMQSSGGAMGVRAACLRPIHIIESGPAAGRRRRSRSRRHVGFRGCPDLRHGRHHGESGDHRGRRPLTASANWM